MPVTVFDLPILVETLNIGDEDCFGILDYPSFVHFMHICLSEELFDFDYEADKKCKYIDQAGEHVFFIAPMSYLRKLVSVSNIQGVIDENFYLNTHQDVARAVAEGQLKNATEHYLLQGYFERRVIKMA